MSPNMVYVYDDHCINCDWVAGGRSCMRHMIAINEQSKPSDYNCNSFKPRTPERELVAQGICGLAERILDNFPTGTKFIMEKETMDEKDKELQELRRKVEDLEKTVEIQKSTISIQLNTIEILTKARVDYMKLLTGLRTLIMDLKKPNTEV